MAKLPTSGTIMVVCMVKIKLSRPAHLIIRNCEFYFNRTLYKKLEMDLVHINKDRRSNYKADDIEKISIHLLAGKSLIPSATRIYSLIICNYFIVEEWYDDKKFRIAFCICSDRPNTIGIMTLFRTKGKTDEPI